MKILHVTPSYYPATYWGGPIFSTKAICDGIAARPDVDLRVLTTNAAGPLVRDQVEPVPLPYRVQYFARMAGHSVAPGLFARLPVAVVWADVVHLTATYSAPTLPTLALARLLRRPVIWSPRGALQATAEWPDAPRQKAKRLFAKAAQIVRPVGTMLHVTAPVEAELSAAQLPGIKTALIPNAVCLPQIAQRQRKQGQLRLMFLSRLHPKKGLERLIAAMAELPDWVTLDIYGTGDADYVASLPQTDRIRLHGPVDGARKQAAFANADLFVLPTYSENFGIVIAEALAHAVPVLTTTAAPWQGLHIHNCGRWIDPDQTSFADEIMALHHADLPAMGARGREWMARDYGPAAMVDAFMALYRQSFCPDGKVSLI